MFACGVLAIVWFAALGVEVECDGAGGHVAEIILQGK